MCVCVRVYIYIYIYVYIYKGVGGIMVIIDENGHSKPSSNSR